MNRFDRELAEYFLAWLPYDGPDPGEVFELFGMSRARAARLLLVCATGARRTPDSRPFRQTAARQVSSTVEEPSDLKLIDSLLRNIVQIQSLARTGSSR